MFIQDIGYFENQPKDDFSRAFLKKNPLSCREGVQIERESIVGAIVVSTG